MRIYEETRDWKCPEESGYEAIVLDFGEGKKVWLSADIKIPRLWNIHFPWSPLAEHEKAQVIDWVMKFLGPGDYLSGCGETCDVEEELFKEFTYRLKDTGCIRVLCDRFQGFPRYYKILQKQ